MMKDTLRAVLATSGASGEETRISAAIQAMVGTAADEIRTDAMGNLICVKHGQPGGKRILFCAHMDQIGLIVIDADEKGFLCVHAVGGVSAQISKGRMVVFPSGVQGVVFAKPSKEALQIKDLYVDIGASSREEALAKVDIGEVCVYRFELAEMGDFVAAPAMDNRAACAVLIELLRALPQTRNEVIGVFTVQEEVGLRGATAAVYRVEPDVGIALDVTLTGDTPDCEPKMAIALGAGPAVKIMDRSVIATPCVRDGLIAAAKAAGVPYQREVLTAGGTDAGAIQISRGGVPSGTLSIPCRYVHTPVETVSLRDMTQCVTLLCQYVEDLS